MGLLSERRSKPFFWIFGRRALLRAHPTTLPLPALRCLWCLRPTLPSSSLGRKEEKEGLLDQESRNSNEGPSFLKGGSSPFFRKTGTRTLSMRLWKPLFCQLNYFPFPSLYHGLPEKILPFGAGSLCASRSTPVRSGTFLSPTWSFWVFTIVAKGICLLFLPKW
jgi:hypothetical protein